MATRKNLNEEQELRGKEELKVRICNVLLLGMLLSSVVDPNTFILDPDPEFWINLDPNPGLCYKF